VQNQTGSFCTRPKPPVKPLLNNTLHLAHRKISSLPFLSTQPGDALGMVWLPFYIYVLVSCTFWFPKNPWFPKKPSPVSEEPFLVSHEFPDPAVCLLLCYKSALHLMLCLSYQSAMHLILSMPMLPVCYALDPTLQVCHALDARLQVCFALDAMPMLPVCYALDSIPMLQVYKSIMHLILDYKSSTHWILV
jgi:hypothetical protein